MVESVDQSFSLLFATEVGPGYIYVHVEITCIDLPFTVPKYPHWPSVYKALHPYWKSGIISNLYPGDTISESMAIL